MLQMDIRSPVRFLQYENSRLREENRLLREEVTQLRRTVEVFCTLQEVSASIDQHTDPLSLLDRILLEALTSIRATDGSLMLVDDETQELVFTVVHGKIEQLLPGYRIPIGVGVAGWVAEHVQPVMVKHARLDSRFFPKIDQNFAFQTNSMLCVPIALGDQISGVIQALNKSNREEFSEADLMLLGGVAQLAAVAISRAESIIPDTPTAE